jgi:hypothetical protein
MSLSSGITPSAITAARRQLALQSASGTAAANVLRSAARPVTSGTVRRATASVKANLVVVYELPAGATDRAGYALLMQLIAALTSESITLSQTKSVLYSMVMAFYPQLLVAGDQVEFKRIVLPKTVETSLEASYPPLVRMKGQGHLTDNARYLATAAYAAMPLLPIDGYLPPVMTGGETPTIPVYAFLGVLAFALTKDVTESGRDALTIARSAAVLSKFILDPDDVPYLTPKYGPSDEAFKHLYSAWRELPFLRRAFFKYMVHVPHAESTIEDLAVFTTIRLMAWGEASHISLMIKFLDAHPLSLDYPKLAPYWTRFAREMTEFMKFCPELLNANGTPRTDSKGVILRDLNFLPYVKLIELDVLSVLIRHEYELPLDIAIHVLRQSDTRLNSYKAPDKYPRAGNEYLDYEAALLEAIRQEDEAIINPAQPVDLSADT